MRDDIVLLVGRLLLAWIFLHEGAFLLINYSASSAGMSKMGVPAFAPPLVIALQLIAGAAIAVGWYAGCGAAALGVLPCDRISVSHQFRRAQRTPAFRKGPGDRRRHVRADGMRGGALVGRRPLRAEYGELDWQIGSRLRPA